MCGRTPRWAMQSLGTEWGRNLIGGDFWVNLWMRRADILLSKSVDVVCDDCRFPNEANAVHTLGGLIVRIYGCAGCAANTAHQSELRGFGLDVGCRLCGGQRDVCVAACKFDRACSPDSSSGDHDSDLHCRSV